MAMKSNDLLHGCTNIKQYGFSFGISYIRENEQMTTRYNTYEEVVFRVFKDHMDRLVLKENLLKPNNILVVKFPTKLRYGEVRCQEALFHTNPVSSSRNSSKQRSSNLPRSLDRRTGRFLCMSPPRPLYPA
jgi:hypothetical protein